ncbi:MAG TPA: class I SAM-dependent methyltransferase [Chthoniobacterales bacterium]|nr:class I SAM-dependent methyltransferase [Chthoniobacterales bacterium]
METTTESEMPAGAGKSSLNPDALNHLLGQMVNDLGAAVNGALIVLGDGLGIYTALADIGKATSQKLAEKTNLNERQLREWLSAQAASGYISYDAASDTFFLTPEQAAVFADPDSPAAMVGGFYGVSAVYHDEPLVAESFRTGASLPWGRHHNCLFCGTERFFRPGYQANISENWIPALDGVQQKLSAGTRVADIGCGHGISTLIMAKAFPNSEFYGFDLHPASIDAANRHAKEQQTANVQFSIAAAKDFPGSDYGFVTVFDALHDMGDPVGAASHVKQALQPDGTFMIVEPLAGDSLAENINPVGRVYYGFSTMICTPGSLSQEVGLALGAQAGERRLRDVLSKGGFTRFRRAVETPFNMILEARP